MTRTPSEAARRADDRLLATQMLAGAKLGGGPNLDAAAKAAWEKLSYSKQRAHAESITGAKAADTRARRVAKVLAALRV